MYVEPIFLKTVLKSGGEYRPEHVLRMRDMIDKYVDCPYRFVCYSDMEIPDVTIRPLLHGWPGWWSKIHLFKDIEDSFYIDLDMTITGNITDMVMVDSDFIALRNMNPRIEGIGSAMMKWRGDYSILYDWFKEDPERYMRENNRIGTNHLGDQSIIWKILDGKIDFFQDKFPNRIKKFNEAGGSVKVFYGKHRPWKNLGNSGIRPVPNRQSS